MSRPVPILPMRCAPAGLVETTATGLLRVSDCGGRSCLGAIARRPGQTGSTLSGIEPSRALDNICSTS